jgi:hypothetical protein
VRIICFECIIRWSFFDLYTLHLIVIIRFKWITLFITYKSTHSHHYYPLLLLHKSSTSYIRPFQPIPSLSQQSHRKLSKMTLIFTKNSTNKNAKHRTHFRIDAKVNKKSLRYYNRKMQHYSNNWVERNNKNGKDLTTPNFQAEVDLNHKDEWFLQQSMWKFPRECISTKRY